MKKTGIIILAAGSSSRLGQPKQLLAYQHKSLLGHTIDAAKKVTNGIVLVILGGNYELIAGNTSYADTNMIYNPDWEEGISSSIRLGLSRIRLENKDLDKVILAVCDQPFIDENIFEGLIKEAAISGKGIVASSYSGTLGTPVLFDKEYFADLAALKGKQGAKIILGKFEGHITSVPFEKGEIDIDTPEDYKRLINNI